MKRKTSLSTIVMAAILSLSSCSLDLSPETNLSDASFWLTDDNFEKACNTFYAFLDAKGLRFDDNRSDFSFGTNANEISSGSRVASATSSDWDSPYQLIFLANKVIDNGNNVDFADRWIAEAKFFRAYAYFDLVTKFGDVPLVLRVLDIGAPEFDAGRTDRETVIRQMYEDLDFAANNLPTFMELGESGYGRASKSAALALKSRIALYFGTHQKYHNWGQPSEHLSLAIAAAEEVMNQGHELYTQRPYYYLFQYDGEGFANKENIFAIIYGENLSNSIRHHNICRDLENGAANVTRYMVDLYLCTDGLPYDKSPLAEYPETDHLSIFRNKDPRMDASIFKEGDPYGNPATYPQLSLNSIRTFFAGRKYSVIDDWITSRSYVDYAIIRYAEVLLIYAEAKFERDGFISNADLDKSINLLRRRVDMPDLTNEFVTGNGLNMLEEIRRERSVELAQEGFRYDDIIRWKIAENVLPRPVIGATYFDTYMVDGLIVTPEGYILAQSADTRSFDPRRDYLYPVPVNEIALSGGTITQNPGW